jgi:hypothetical protein|tara:strand:- start:1049 stop:1459 length:411 start_codon:yes stop_codon:yes gene_type:complete
MREKKMINYTGSCICGEIKFTVDIDEKPRVFNCHCIDCRKKVGGIITIIQLRDNALKINDNKLEKYTHKGGSKKIIIKSFCKICAAPITTFVEKWGVSYLYAGLLDDLSLLKESKNIFYENSHFPFLEIKEKGLKI